MLNNQTLPNLQASLGFDRSANLNSSLIGPTLYWDVYGMEGFILNFNFSRI
jgi:methylaspartate ammonia-lyase